MNTKKQMNEKCSCGFAYDAPEKNKNFQTPSDGLKRWAPGIVSKLTSLNYLKTRREDLL
jgi:hypothetical protein